MLAIDWDVVHHIGFLPSVTIVDSGGTVVEGDVEHIDANRVELTFGVPFAGQAFCS